MADDTNDPTGTDNSLDDEFIQPQWLTSAEELEKALTSPTPLSKPWSNLFSDPSDVPEEQVSCIPLDALFQMAVNLIETEKTDHQHLATCSTCRRFHENYVDAYYGE